MGTIQEPTPPDQTRRGLLWLVIAAVCFHAAYSCPGLGILILGYPFALVRALPHLSGRHCFYGGLALGLFLYGPHLRFFWTLFQAAAVLLWLILAVWLALFMILGRLALLQFQGVGRLIIPVLWMGLEYARSELYPLKFSWMNAGYPLEDSALRLWLTVVGIYSVGALSATAAVLSFFRWRHVVVATSLGAILLFILTFVSIPMHSRPPRRVHVAGMQLEESQERDLPRHLGTLIQRHPNTELVVLHEYLLSGTVPREIQEWCRRERRWLVVGGRKELGGELWQNTAFVVDTNGAVVFEQGKKTPIQFFQDGVAATRQELWDSPWGKVGIAICYDLSYTRVMDELVAKGAQLLIVPTMDAINWGESEHALHARVAPVRALEYRVPIIRVASSGISQIVNSHGRAIASAPYPGQESSLAAPVSVQGSGHLPIDRVLAPFASLVTLLFPGLCWLRRTR